MPSKRLQRFILTFIALLATFTLVARHHAVAQELVYDLNRFGASSDPRPVEMVGDNIFFFASDGIGGRALYRLEPESGDVRRLTSGSSSREPNPPSKTGGGNSVSGIEGEGYNGLRTFHDLAGVAVFFFEDDLWRSDGTEAGTYLLRAFDYVSYEYVVGGGRFFFWGGTDSGIELWTTDGTREGTHRIDATPRLEFHERSGLAYLGDSLYFTAPSRTATGESLWRSGGGINDAEEVDDSPPMHIWEFPLTAGGRFFFRASDHTVTRTGHELWVSDGTASGTKLLKDIQTGHADSEPWNFQVLNGQVLFQAWNQEVGGELWTTDGTTDATTIVKDINPGSESSGGYYFEQFGDKSLFGATDGVHGDELWITDGTETGTALIRDINPGSASSNVRSTRKHRDLVYFSADDGVIGSELWLTDGTAEGTRLAIDLGGTLPSEPANLLSVGDDLYFSARTLETGRELWVSDGTQAGTRLAIDIVDFGTESSSVRHTQVQPDGDIIVAGSDGHIAGLWKLSTDPHRAPTLLTGLDRLSSWTSATVGDISYFNVGTRLYRTDGSSDGTFPLLSNPAFQFAELDGRLFAVEWSNVWVTDGSVVGTRKVFADTISNSLVAASGNLIYVLRGTNQDYDLWNVDGDGNAQLVEGMEGIRFINAILVNPSDHLLFGNDSGIHAIDPTGTEYRMLALLDSDSTQATSGTLINDIVYFGIRGRPLYAPASNTGLWRSDGTPEGTYRLPIEPRLASNAIAVDDVVFFLEESNPDWNIWVFDPSTAEAIQLPVTSPFVPKVFAAYDDRLVFSAEDGVHGVELWQSDGTLEGTTMLADMHPGPPSSDPSDFAVGTDGFYFSATTPEYGRELFFIDDMSVEAERVPTRPNDIALDAYPNPFTTASNIAITIGASRNLTVEMFDVLGRRVQRLYSGPTDGSDKVQFLIDGNTLASGLYFVRATGDSGSATTTVVVSK